MKRCSRIAATTAALALMVRAYATLSPRTRGHHHSPSCISDNIYAAPIKIRSAK